MVEEAAFRPTTASHYERARRIALIPLSLFCVLFLVEFPAALNLVNYSRVVGPAAMDVFLATNKSDPELLHIHPPHSHFSGSALGGNVAANFKLPASALTLYRWDVTYDQNGFRNDHDLTSADVAVIGDSFVEETNIPTEQLMTSHLANLESNVVANLGQYGYGPLEELAVLKRYALPLQPQIVLWMFYEGNDLKDVVHHQQAVAAKPPGYWSRLWERSFTSNALAQIHFRLRPLLRPSGVKHSGVMQASDGRKIIQYFLYSSSSFSPEDLKAIDETTATIAAANKLCADRKTRLVFVFIPTKFRVYHSLCQFPPESDCSQWKLNDLPDRLKKAVAAMSPQVGFVDLTPSLVDAAAKGNAPYYSDDDHWTPSGQQIGAEALSAYLTGANNI